MERDIEALRSQLRAHERIVEARLSKILEHQKSLLGEVRAQRREEARWRWRFRRQLESVVRHQAVSGFDIAGPHWLDAQRFRLRSQHEEDGITLALLRAAGVVNRRFVEIGCGKSGGNSAMLAFEFGWSGLMVDAGRGKVETLARELARNTGVKCVRALVTPDNFNQLLDEHGFTGEIDFMSIDVDSVDYWLLDALRACSPRVLVMEYNARFGPARAVTLPSHGLPERLPNGYSGASLAALDKKAREKGYRLVLCEPAGVNAFFLRNDVAPSIPRTTAAAAFRLQSTGEDEGSDRAALAADIYAFIEEQRLPLVEV